MSTAANLNYGRQRRACVKFASSQHYQRDAFVTGLYSLGYGIDARPSGTPSQGDLLVLWNRYSRDEREARAYEKEAADVLIVENAWLGPDVKPQTCFAICRNHHNGAGTWHVGTEPRPIDWPIKPWRADGKYILVLPQRGMGEDGIRMPRDWPQTIGARLAKVTARPLKWRLNPGVRPHPPMDADLEDCWAAVTWASGAAIKAICAGIPVFYELPEWIGAPCAQFGIGDLEKPYMGDRTYMLHRLSWAQWTVEEIARGEPFRWLLKF